MPIDRDDGEIMGPRPHGKLPMGHRTRAVYDECLAELIGGYPGLEGFHERVRIDRALLVLAGDHAIDVQKLVRQPVRDARNVNLANSKGHPGAKASGKLPDPVAPPPRGRPADRVCLQQNLPHSTRLPPASPFLCYTTRTQLTQ